MVCDGIREDQAPDWPRWGSLDPSKAANRRSEIAVGKVVFVHDVNSRVYTRRNGGPDYRHQFVPREVVGETSRSWLVGWSHRYGKHPKADPQWLFGLEDVEDAIWRNQHAYRIGQHVGSIRDVDLLRKIAEITGFKP